MEAAAEGLYIGRELIVPCIYCGTNRYKVCAFLSDTTFKAYCLNCGYTCNDKLKDYRGTGRELA